MEPSQPLAPCSWIGPLSNENSSLKFQDFHFHFSNCNLHVGASAILLCHILRSHCIPLLSSLGYILGVKKCLLLDFAKTNQILLIWSIKSHYIFDVYSTLKHCCSSLQLCTRAWQPENTQSSSHYVKFITVSEQWCAHVACQWTRVSATTMS